MKISRLEAKSTHFGVPRAHGPTNEVPGVAAKGIPHRSPSKTPHVLSGCCIRSHRPSVRAYSIFTSPFLSAKGNTSIVAPAPAKAHCTLAMTSRPRLSILDLVRSLSRSLLRPLSLGLLAPESFSLVSDSKSGQLHLYRSTLTHTAFHFFNSSSSSKMRSFDNVTSLRP